MNCMQQTTWVELLVYIKSNNTYFICVVKPPLFLKPLLHMSQTNGVSSECVLIWYAKLPACPKFFPHNEHIWGRSPLWVLRWFLSVEYCIKAFEQIKHLWGRSPESYIERFLILGFDLFNLRDRARRRGYGSFKMYFYALILQSINN